MSKWKTLALMFAALAAGFALGRYRSPKPAALPLPTYPHGSTPVVRKRTVDHGFDDD